ncbi:hypothetical protein F511_34502 [Dorcoceras hygrometricum]|uniref:Uncharacterized protein n=1 Tax=Dorcoceras hygrometricum TaxID=472368 RepID=A0A2Z7AUK6_9LAMI|nr:hypothetical protein F511_34502 [Dorcoceras hygrometricum]
MGRGQASVRRAIKTANHATCYNNSMKCMRAIKDRIARPVYQLANYLSQPLYPHGVSTGKIIEERSGKISQKASNEQALRVSSNPRFQSPNWYQSVEKLKRSSAPPISFKTTAGHGGNRRERITVNSSYRGFRRMEIRDIG